MSLITYVTITGVTHYLCDYVVTSFSGETIVAVLECSILQINQSRCSVIRNFCVFKHFGPQDLLNEPLSGWQWTDLA